MVRQMEVLDDEHENVNPVSADEQLTCLHDGISLARRDPKDQLLLSSYFLRIEAIPRREAPHLDVLQRLGAHDHPCSLATPPEVSRPYMQ